MIIFAIESSAPVGGVALADSDRVIAHIQMNVERTYSERLMPAVVSLMELTGYDWDSIDAVAVDIGPGSFTGLRIGVSTAKGLAMASDKPIYGISSLKALAASAVSIGSPVVTMVEARRNEVYAQIFDGSVDRQDGISEASEITVVPYAELGKFCPENCVLAGEILYRDRENIMELLPASARIAPEMIGIPGAAQIAVQAIKETQQRPADNVMNLVPNYIRPAATTPPKKK